MFFFFRVIHVFSQNKKTNEYPCKPQFYYIKVGFKGIKIIYSHVFVMVYHYSVVIRSMMLMMPPKIMMSSVRVIITLSDLSLFSTCSLNFYHSLGKYSRRQTDLLFL